MTFLAAIKALDVGVGPLTPLLTRVPGVVGAAKPVPWLARRNAFLVLLLKAFAALVSHRVEPTAGVEESPTAVFCIVSASFPIISAGHVVGAFALSNTERRIFAKPFLVLALMITLPVLPRYELVALVPIFLGPGDSVGGRLERFLSPLVEHLLVLAISKMLRCDGRGGAELPFRVRDLVFDLVRPGNRVWIFRKRLFAVLL